MPGGLKIVDRVDFESERDGAWQKLPEQVLDLLAKRRPVAAIKFGMGLLRVPEELECRILSYHHGDPRRFRGRPAGFYEILERAPAVGQIVQIISNRLDAGTIVAFGETRVQPYSYRATMAEAYRLSPLLMKTAVQNCLAGKSLPIDPQGRNYRLPSNATVLRFGARLLSEKIRRFFYGAFFEKAWEVASADVDRHCLEQLIAGIDDSSRWRTVRRPRRYQFLADPFPHPWDGVLVEALRRSDGQGEIAYFAEDREEVLCAGPGHFSYPATVRIGDDWFMVPEVSEWASPKVCRLNRNECQVAGELEVGGVRLVDATLHAREDGVYLFANDASEGSAVLRLWTADTLFSKFTEHAESPIRISPVGARMGGAILEIGGRLYRPGQDCARGYGRRIVLFEILELSRMVYEEASAGEIAFRDVSGPHTLNLRDSTAFFDFYRERFTPLAGLRRLRARAAKRRAVALSSPKKP